MHYYLSLGSNIEPEKNAVKMLAALANRFGAFIAYPFYYTPPVKITSGHPFLNSLAIIPSGLQPDAFKAELNCIEIRLGRDRSDPLRSQKDRTADIDILKISAKVDTLFFENFDEPYINIFTLGKDKRADLSAFGLPTTERATTVDLDTTTGHIRVVDSALDGQQYWLKPSF
ncbi:MAG: 2-amino-4-hydroxy-6-hydroxymethyldihydropteridine diphosphokinase [Agarilytica sp.]